MASATLIYNSQTDWYEFTISHIKAANYAAALTCNISLDINTKNNSVDNIEVYNVACFSAAVNVSFIIAYDLHIIIE